MKRSWLIWIAVILTVIAWAPAAAVLLGAGLARLTGCRVDEGSIHPCPVGPVDVGGLLYGLGVSGWLFLASWPLALASVLFWAGFIIRAVVRLVRGGSPPTVSP